MDLTAHWVGFTAIILFVAAYSLVITEEFTHLRKSKPVMLAAGIIWALIAYQYAGSDQPHATAEAVQEYLTEFAQLFLFLLAAMTYVNAMSERQVFLALRGWLARRSYTYRTMFWITGFLSFFLSPVIDNLTTALVMCAVVMAIGQGNPRFIGIACINIVVAANAGGAFSPFGDITTLMVWQRGIVELRDLFSSVSSQRRQLPGAGDHDVACDIQALGRPGGGRTSGAYETRRQAHHVSFRLHDYHRRLLPQLSAPAAISRHDDRSRGAQVLRLLPAHNARRNGVRSQAVRSRSAIRRRSTASAKYRGSSGIRCCSSSASSCVSAASDSSAISIISRPICTGSSAPPSPMC